MINTDEGADFDPSNRSSCRRPTRQELSLRWHITGKVSSVRLARWTNQCSTATTLRMMGGTGGRDSANDHHTESFARGRAMHLCGAIVLLYYVHSNG